MSLAEGVSARVAYKFYASGGINANAPAVSASDLGAPGAQILRRVSTSIKLGKDSYQASEVRSDGQIVDFRHGVRRVSGGISGELSPKTYADFMQAVLRGAWAAAVTVTEADLTSIAADADTFTFTFGSGDPVVEGLKVGQVFELTGASVADNNGVRFLITGFSGANNRTMNVYPAPTDMTADTEFSLATQGKVVDAPSSGRVKRKLAVELYNEDIDFARLYTECRVGGVNVKLPATGMSTIDINIMGRDMEEYDGVSAPFFTTPTAETSTGLLAAVNGLLMVNGTVQGVLTSLEIDIDLAPSADPVVGQNIVPEIFLGRANVTGNATAMFQDGALIGNFADEDEVSILAWLVTESAPDSPGMVFYLPRIKFSDADVSNQGEGGQTISMPFQALKYVGSAPGVTQTTIQITDTELS